MTERVINDVVDAVPQYQRFFGSDRGDAMRAQIETALRTFLEVIDAPGGVETSRLAPALEAAEAMGRSEAQQGRDSHIVLNAFRAGGRAAWRFVVEAAVSQDMGGAEVADLADSLFDFIDRISAATVRGHQAETMSAQELRVRGRDEVVRSLVTTGAVSEAQAERAGWRVPRAVLLVTGPDELAAEVGRLLGVGDLMSTGPYGAGAQSAVLAIVDATGPAARAALLRRAAVVGVIVSPAVAPAQLPAALRWCLGASSETGAVTDIDRRLDEVLVAADPELAAFLRTRHLTPLTTQNPGMQVALEQTLDAWLRHRGRQDHMAEALHVHPQTVRYRLARLRDLLGPTVDDPALTLQLLTALTSPSGRLLAKEAARGRV